MSEKLRSANRSAGLAARRRKGRRRALVVFVILFSLMCAAAVYALWRPALRITQVDIYGTALPLTDIVLKSMEGSYMGLAPRNSTFLIPAPRIRSEILAAHPTIAAVSIFRKGFTGLTVKVTDRAPVARWCPLSPDAADAVSPTGNCYLFDASGVLFAVAASSTETIYPFTLYAPLDTARGEPLAGESLELLGSRIAEAGLLPPAFDFARALARFDARVERIVIRGDEANHYLTSGTRVTYVLGREQGAHAALVSAGSQLSLDDGSLEYVDLRFEGKVYLKRIGGSKQEQEQ